MRHVFEDKPAPAQPDHRSACDQRNSAMVVLCRQSLCMWSMAALVVGMGLAPSGKAFAIRGGPQEVRVPQPGADVSAVPELVAAATREMAAKARKNPSPAPPPSCLCDKAASEVTPGVGPCSPTPQRGLFRRFQSVRRNIGVTGNDQHPRLGSCGVLAELQPVFLGLSHG